MLVRQFTPHPRRSPRGAALTLLAVIALAGWLIGCQSWDAARHYRAGTQHLIAGDAELAVEALEEARRIAPEISSIHNHLGLAYVASGRRDAAVAALENAVALDCDNLAAQRNLAAARAGEWDSLLP